MTARTDRSDFSRYTPAYAMGRELAMIWKAVEYPKSYFESLAQRVEKAGLPRFVLESLVYGAQMEDDKIDMGRLSKLTRDMVARFRS